MNPIHEIKSRLDIAEIAGEHLQLQRSGKNWKANCPFHPDKTPSFVIFPGSQRFTCFGIGCNRSGDLFDLLQGLNGWDFSTTLRYLAEKAGVSLAPLSEEEQALANACQAREEVFRAAMSYFQGHLFRPAPSFKGTQEGEIKPDMGYALGRGWTKETLAEAGIGSFGSDREGLRRYLKGAGVDMDLPAAAALLGKRGDIAGWAGRHGLQPARDWLERDRIPSMPNQMLIYPHLERGRVAYLAGRSIEGKAHWNPPRELAGPRRPYYNVHWWGKPGAQDGSLAHAVVVEGQGDALTLAQWGVPAVALAGCSIQGTDLLDGILCKAKSARITLALDSDEAGQQGGARAAALLSRAGLLADQIGMLRWPERDANAWLAAGAGAEQALDLLERAPTWLDELVRQSKESPRDEAALLRVFEALSGLPQHRLLFHKQQVCARLKIYKPHFDELLKAARLQAANAEREGSSGGGAQAAYLVRPDGIYLRSYNAHGCQVLERLSNFSARIEQEIRCDDGQQTELEFLVGGETGGRALPALRVRAEQFERMDWVLPGWGSVAIIEPGPRRRDQLRAAIQSLSAGVQPRKVFTHTGWRVLEAGAGRRVYLSGAGALGGPGGGPVPEGVDVQLDSDLGRYQLPGEPHDPVEAMQTSLGFLELAPLEISAPLWASVWLAPLSEILAPNFVVWLYGRTGTLKSTLAALAHAMAGYLGWLAENWPGYVDSLPEQWRRHREKATGQDMHLRLPETAASLMMGWEMGLRYAHSIGALNGDEYGRLMQEGWIVLLGTSVQMTQHAKEERPEELFLGTFRELLAQGKVYLRERGGLRTLGGGEGGAGVEERAEMLGWFDLEYIYLLPEAAYTRIAKHFRDQGSLFPVRQQTLRKGLREAGWLVVKDERMTSVIKLDGRAQRVLVLKREVIGEDALEG